MSDSWSPYSLGLLPPAEPTANPLEFVRTSARITPRRHVTVDDAQLTRLVADLHEWWKVRKSVKWNEDDLHYSNTSDPELLCKYIILMDAMNFCFWPSHAGMEYDHLSRGLRSVFVERPAAVDIDALVNVSSAEVETWFPESIRPVPLIEERTRIVRDVATAIQTSFGGSAAEFVKSANRSAAALVRLLHKSSPGFRDVAQYDGQWVGCYKRAQILCGDLYGAFKTAKENDPSSPAAAFFEFVDFTDLNELTAFPDYRLPQLLRHVGVMKYDTDLEKRIDAKEQIPAGTAEEVEIRLATVEIVERLRHELLERLEPGSRVLSIEVDWWLWQTGEKMKDDIPPHHRTLSIFY